MDLNKKRVLIIPLEGVIAEGDGLTDFHICREILDKIRKTGISRMAIIIGESDDKDFYSKAKAIEFFVFSYCKIAVSSHRQGDTLLDEVMETLPHSLRKRELFVSVGEKITGIDFITLEEFV